MEFSDVFLSLFGAQLKESLFVVFSVAIITTFFFSDITAVRMKDRACVPPLFSKDRYVLKKFMSNITI